MLPSGTVAAIGPLVAELERLEVAYYVVGSVVSSAYGIPRSTLDVDLVADLAPEHVAPLVEVLRPAYYIDAGMISEAIARKSCFNLIHLATSFKVDVFAVKDREYDRVALKRAEKKSIDAENPSYQLPFASPEDTVLGKLEWFRLGHEVSQQQWRDVMGVLKVQKNFLDKPYLQKWAAELGIGDLLERACSEAEA